MKASNYLSNTKKSGVCGDGGVSTPDALRLSKRRRQEREKRKLSRPRLVLGGATYTALVQNIAGISSSTHREMRRDRNNWGNVNSNFPEKVENSKLISLPSRRDSKRKLQSKINNKEKYRQQKIQSIRHYTKWEQTAFFHRKPECQSREKRKVKRERKRTSWMFSRKTPEAKAKEGMAGGLANKGEQGWGHL